MNRLHRAVEVFQAPRRDEIHRPQFSGFRERAKGLGPYSRLLGRCGMLKFMVHIALSAKPQDSVNYWFLVGNRGMLSLCNPLFPTENRYVAVLRRANLFSIPARSAPSVHWLWQHKALN